MRPASRYQRPNWGLYLVGGLVLIFLIVPTIIVVPMSFSASSFLEFPPRQWSLRWYHSYFGSQSWLDATWVSLKAATLTALLATPIGTAAAYALHRVGFRMRSLLSVIILTPAIVPVILIGIGVFVLYARLGLNTTLTGLVLAHIVMALPFVVLTVSAGLTETHLGQEMAARSLGAHPIRAFVGVTLPQIWSPVAAAGFLAFMTSLDEVVVALLISGGDNATITRRMFNALRDEVDPTVAAISSCLIVCSVLVMGLFQLATKTTAPAAKDSLSGRA